jgi:hypothetical protein
MTARRFSRRDLARLVAFFCWLCSAAAAVLVSSASTSSELVCRKEEDTEVELLSEPNHQQGAWKRFWKKLIPILLPVEMARLRFPSPPPERTGEELVFSDPRQRRVARLTSSLTDPASGKCLANAYPSLGPSESTLEDTGVCMVLSVCHDEACTSLDAAYELLEPVELALGGTVKHAVDYAYEPVLSREVEPIVVPDTSLMEDLADRHRDAWWQWWIPWSWKQKRPNRDKYRMNEAFAGGSHGQVWRGRRKCSRDARDDPLCGEPLIFKRLKVEAGYRTLEAGLREVYIGEKLARQHPEQTLFTEYVEHFFGEGGELWIVFRDAGASLRSILYTGTDVGEYIVYQHSWLWTLIRMSLAQKNMPATSSTPSPAALSSQASQQGQVPNSEKAEAVSVVGKRLIGTILRQILEATAFLHENGVIHRDIKPSNLMCRTNLDLEHLQSLDVGNSPEIHCVLGDFSSAYDEYTDQNLYTRGPSRAEQTDEYAPPEAIFGQAYNRSVDELTPAFDSWSIGVVALELLLGTPNVFSVDQRTR